MMKREIILGRKKRARLCSLSSVIIAVAIHWLVQHQSGLSQMVGYV